MDPRCMPLALARAGIKLTVTDIQGGFGLQRRMADLGLIPGVSITIMSGCHPGPLLIDVRGSRLGLGFGVAQKITVREAQDDR